jgi:hypothetical protein
MVAWKVEKISGREQNGEGEEGEEEEREEERSRCFTEGMEIRVELRRRVKRVGQDMIRWWKLGCR